MVDEALVGHPMRFAVQGLLRTVYASAFWIIASTKPKMVWCASIEPRSLTVC